ncbi:hypothetical protein L798_05765 [Zootermopsis nevadensis]|uniref:Uncharacterized protein n=1 Tax=Zootermopsis nevadensis TaxID=136037 RepID=A0A067R8F1_ZOONE|nr:hypothetical protein L798_05765 [Zootermopsis nevadensis]
MFRCKYGGCILMNLTCNGEPQCVDWSDEDPILCGLTVPPGSCHLPALSPYSHYNATNCPMCQPGAVVAQHHELNYSCEVGHKLQGSSSVYCHDSAWVPQLPTCIPANGEVVCPPVSSPRLSVTCESRWGNRRGWIPCDNPLPVGTIARYQCQQYYIPNGDEHQRNTFSECQKDGTWSTDILKCVPGRLKQECKEVFHFGKYNL